MGGVDVIAFTAGIGEHSALIRRRSSERLEFMGVVLDAATNDALTLTSDAPVAAFNAAASRVHLLAVRADEELAMARAAASALQQ
jgi:acetate kinase